jgi:hypothetical protein
VDKRERVMAALEGSPVDRVPFSLWRHFPESSRAGAAMAAAHLEYDRATDPDFLKVMNDNYYEPPRFRALEGPSDWRALMEAPLREDGGWRARPVRGDSRGDEVQCTGGGLENPAGNGGKSLHPWRGVHRRGGCVGGEGRIGEGRSGSPTGPEDRLGLPADEVDPAEDRRRPPDFAANLLGDD